MQLASYRSHKIVKAGKIVALLRGGESFGGSELWLVIECDGGSLAAARVYDDLFARYAPVIGDYLVEYEDGYRSLSPRKAFEDGYTRS